MPSWLPAGARAAGACPPESGRSETAAAVGRVRDRATFQAFRRSRRRARRGPLAVTWVPADPGAPPRVAYAIGRSVGGAVVRNRLRRRLRAVVAELGPSLAPGAYLVAAASEATALTHGELRSTLAEGLAAVTGQEPR